jgi:hypothetical protein
MSVSAYSLISCYFSFLRKKLRVSLRENAAVSSVAVNINCVTVTDGGN